MALTVGELRAYITLDDSAVTTGLRQAERAMRAAGQRMGQDADQAGQQAGQNLGDGVTNGLRGLRDDAQRIGRQTGDSLGDGLTDGARRAGDDAGGALGDGLGDSGEDGAQRATGRIGGALGKLKLAAAGVGAAAGAVLMDAFGQAMEQGQITAKLGAQLGATPAEAKKYGQAAGALFKGAIVSDFQEGADTIKAVAGAGLIPPDATNAQIKSIGTHAADLANTFDQDLGGVTNAVSQMLRTGLAKNADEAFDILAKGFQSSANKADDLLDTFNEYGTQFRKAGVDGSQAVGLMNQAIEHGARDSDIAADAIKEFSIRAVDGSKSTAQGFKALGLNADDMSKKFAKGGKTANGVLDLTLDKLRNVKDPVKQAQIATQLFGTQAEDLGKALFAMDPSKAVDGIGQVGGAADKLGTSLRDNASSKVTAFKNSLQQNVVEFLGNKVIPKLTTVFEFVQDHSTAFKFAAIFVGILGTAFAIAAIGVWAFNSALLANPVFWIVAGIIVAVAGLVLLIVTYWDQIKAATLVAWDWVVGKIAYAVGAVMTAIGWLAGIPGMVAGWWTAMKNKAVSIALAWVAWVKGLPGKISGAVAAMAGYLKSRASEAFTAFRNAAVVKITAFIGWVRGIPGRVTGAIGAVKGLLYNKGRDIVLGLWNGVVGMGGWLRSKIMGWARAVIPGPVAKALGIGSPSKLMADEIGHWIPAGIAMGAEKNSGVLEDTMANLVNTPTPSASMALGVSSAMNGGSARHNAMAPKVVKIGSDGSAFGDLLVAELRKKLAALGGDVQFVLGS